MLPEHIGIIMDGNGRWAKKRALPRRMGHREGARVFQNIATYCNKIGIKYLTAYAFSTENWQRPAEEVEAIMNLLRDYLRDAHKHRDEDICTRFIGDRTPLAPDIIQLMEEAEEASRDARGMVLNVAINYGGRAELVKAVRELIAEGQEGSLRPGEVDYQTIAAHFYTAGQPDPDLIIRPSGEYRLSNFLTCQSAYSELIFMDVLWPDFRPSHLEEALDEYARRNRRFGGI